MKRFGALLFVLALIPVPAHGAGPQPPRIMLVGDSVTQGSAGDWTWRYRLWQHLGPGVTYVGPRTDLYDGNQDYADPAFDTHHAAKWGVTFDEQADVIAERVRTYDPDVVLTLLGANDLGTQAESPDQAIADAQEFIANARSADPGITVVIGRLPWPWLTGTQAFNTGLADLVARETSPTSPVRMADIEDLVFGTDTYDYVHPAANGEVKIAAGFADALSALGVGTAYPRPLVPAPNVPITAPVLSASAGDRQVTLSWTNPPGSTATEIWLRGPGEAWQRLPLAVTGTTWQMAMLTNHTPYEFRVGASKGMVSSSVTSNVVTATPRPLQVQGLRAVAQRHAVRLSWQPTIAGAYVVRWPGGSQTTSATQATVTGLTAGRTYGFTVASDGRATSIQATPTGPIPRAPRSLRVQAHQLRWTGRAAATHYEVLRAKGYGWRRLGWTAGTRFHVSKPGQYQVRSWHQRLPGGWATVLVGA